MNLPLKILQNLTFSRENPAKSADFSANCDFFPAKIPWNQLIFPRICPWKSREIFLLFPRNIRSPGSGCIKWRKKPTGARQRKETTTLQDMPVSSALFVFPLYNMAFLYQLNNQLKGGLFRYPRMQCRSTPFKRSTFSSGLACECWCTKFWHYKGQKKVKGLTHNKETKWISYAYHLKQKRNLFHSWINNSL